MDTICKFLAQVWQILLIFFCLAFDQNVGSIFDENSDIGVARILSGVHFSSPQKLTTSFLVVALKKTR